MTKMWNNFVCQNNYDCHTKADSTFIEFISLTMQIFSFFSIFSTAFCQRCWMDQIMLHALWMPTSSLSTYHWNIMDQFSKSTNSNHFYSPCSFFRSQKVNSYVVSSTCRWPIYVVIPKTVCLEFMLATAQQCWAFPNSFSLLPCILVGNIILFG